MPVLRELGEGRPVKDPFAIWSVVSAAWTEIGLGDEEYPRYAQRVFAAYSDWEEVNAIIIKDVCASFAFDQFLYFPCMLWMWMPDWGYDEDYLRKRMSKWYGRPYWSHFLNPFRILGYPLALLFSGEVRKKLEKEYKKLAVQI